MKARLSWLALPLLLALGCERDPAPQGRPGAQGLPPSSGSAPTVATPDNPHAGMAMGGAGASHPSMGGADNSGGAEMATPEPPPLDPNKVIEGTIDVSPELAKEVKPGDVVFLSARVVDASGQVQRMPVAVDRVEVNTLPAPFRLSNQNVMVQGTDFTGTVQVTARLDRDHEAMSKQPGDLEGVLQATIPAKEVKLVLDKKIQ